MWTPGPDEVVLEGLHALKHALRFGAEVREAVTPSRSALLALAESLAPDLVAVLSSLVVEVPGPEFGALWPRTPASPVLARAVRRTVSAAAVLSGSSGFVVLLDDPRHAGNAGAVVRVAAAAGCGGVLVTGALDPWAPAVVRAAAGLHWAVPVAACSWPLPAGRPLVAFDPDGGVPEPFSLPPQAVLAFGSERRGLSGEVLAAADRIVRLPMTEGVSSLNLATSVAAALYAAKLVRPQGPG